MEQFLYILSSHLYLVLFFLVASSHERPGAQLNLDGGVFESSSHWTPMVTSQSIGVLDLQRSDDCVISNIVNLHGGGGVGICETTRYCFSSFEFGTP